MSVQELLATPAFKQVTTRVTEGSDPASAARCATSAGPPARRRSMPSTAISNAPAPMCDFYVAQARYAFRVIAQGRLDDYLWDGWKDGLEPIVVM